jgi:hypothetical protein
MTGNPPGWSGGGGGYHGCDVTITDCMECQEGIVTAHNGAGNKRPNQRPEPSHVCWKPFKRHPLPAIRIDSGGQRTPSVPVAATHHYRLYYTHSDVHWYFECH